MIVINWIHVERLLQPSIADQVRLIVPVPLQPSGCINSSTYPTNAGPHRSVAVAEPVLAGSVEASHEIVILTGQVMAGLVLSITVMN